ncbi:unnamed protein product [Rangifer tarandus platyrhynchus]|uniref:BRCA2 and CDKN1A-interacting protein n=1 Tax=Rangifer tarandus platyrhynchus TaxID=3082113 RepID=A0ABN8ZNC9_RANTA|nr:unnamed protein product [Rangifer tarandus platyrhynchus]
MSNKAAALGEMTGKIQNAGCVFKYKIFGDEEKEDEVEEVDEDDSDEEEDEEDEVINEEVNIEFEAYSISDNDYDGIKKLTTAAFPKSPYSDDDVDEDEIFGFISLLNLTERKGTPCAEQIKELILRLCEKNCEKSTVEQLDRLFNDTARPVGFLLSERFINVPPQIALPMHQQLQKELAEAHRTNKPCGKCHLYLLISKTFVEAGKSGSKKRRSSQNKELMFANAEEEFFYQKAILKFNYSVQEESDSVWEADGPLMMCQ